MTSRLRRYIPVLVVAALFIASCGDDSDSAEAPPDGDGTVAASDFAEVAETYADLVFASYGASIDSAEALQDAIDDLTANPSDDTLEAARGQWLAARDDYGPTEAFRFYDGPIDDPEDGPEGQINAWPMDEAYVDYVVDNPDAGIINDTAGFPDITADVIVAANEEGGETNISTGWHAIEFLLWGQDVSADAPGDRPVTDYTTAPNAERRATYLTLLADQLVADLEDVASQWDPDGGAYREAFLADPQAAVEHIFRGIGALSAGELAGERMAVAFETKDQEDEHSCFSDNTNADVLNNALGVRMVYLADFDGIDGKSPSDLVASVDPDLDATLRAQLDESVGLVEDFPDTFEAMIVAPEGDPANEAFGAALSAIETQGETIAEAATALGLEISITV